MDHSQMGHHANMDHSAMDQDHSQHMMQGGHGRMADGGSAGGGHVEHNPMVAHEHADPEMSHAMHGGLGGGHSMMMMYFHGGFNEVILFDFWRINSVGGLVGSMAIIFIMGVCYEALKALRDALYSKHVDATSAARDSNGDAVPNDAEEQKNRRGGNMRSKVKTWVKRVETNMWSKFHFLQSLLYSVQMILAYLIMLIFMTYNSWLCVAVIAGLTVGYFAFGWRKTVVLEQSGDGCH